MRGGFQRQELESDNRRLKQDLGALRKSLSDDSGPLAPPKPGSKTYSVLLEQLDSSYEELEMRKEEVLLLRSHMVRQEVLKHKVGGVASSQCSIHIVDVVIVFIFVVIKPLCHYLLSLDLGLTDRLESQVESSPNLLTA